MVGGALSFVNGEKSSDYKKSSTLVDLSSLPEAGKLGDDPSITLPDDLFDEGLDQWKFSLIGRLDFQKLKVADAEIILKNQWSLQGSCQIIPIGKGFFIIKLDNELDRNSIKSGSCEVEEQFVRLRDWEPNFRPENQRVSTSFVWVRFPGLCLEFWKEKILLAIGKGIGRPIKVDDATLRYEYGYYASVLIEIDFAKPVPEKIWIKTKFGGFYQKIEILKVPKFCSSCKIVGHIVSECRALRTFAENQVVQVNAGTGGKWKKNKNKNKEVSSFDMVHVTEVPSLNPIADPSEVHINSFKDMNAHGLEEGEFHLSVDDASVTASKDVGHLVVDGNSVSKDVSISMNAPGGSSNMVKKKKLNNKKVTISVGDINSDTEVLSHAQLLADGASSTSTDPSIPPGFENYNRFHGLEEEEEVATSELVVKNAEIGPPKPAMSEPILALSRKVSSKTKATGLFPNGILSSKKKAAPKSIFDPNMYSASTLLDFGSGLGLSFPSSKENRREMFKDATKSHKDLKFNDIDESP